MGGPSRRSAPLARAPAMRVIRSSRRAAMPDRKGAGSTDYVVGYGRPPKATQFAPGKSGNPRGRPKGSRTVGAILEDILGRKIGVTENGKTRRVPTLEVMLLRLANDAMRTDRHA